MITTVVIPQILGDAYGPEERKQTIPESQKSDFLSILLLTQEIQLGSTYGIWAFSLCLSFLVYKLCNNKLK